MSYKQVLALLLTAALAFTGIPIPVMAQNDVMAQNGATEQCEDGVTTTSLDGESKVISGLDGEDKQSDTVGKKKNWEIYIKGDSFVYSGAKKEPEVEVCDENRLIDDSEYKLSYENNVNAGTAKVIVQDKKEGTRYTKTFEIAPCPIDNMVYEDIQDHPLSNPIPTEDEIIVYYNVVFRKAMVPNKDFTYTCRNFGAVGSVHGYDTDPMVVLTGTGNFTGTRIIRFSIYNSRSEGNTSITKAKVSNVRNRVYTGDVITQCPTVTLRGKILTEGTDYYITYLNRYGYDVHTEPGKMTMVVHGIGKYKGTVKKKFLIKRCPLNASGISFSLDYYTGSYKKWGYQPGVVIRDMQGRPLLDEVDYTRTASKSSKHGVNVITIKATEDSYYTGTKKLYYRHSDQDQRGVKLDSTIPDYYYTGESIKPEIKELTGTDEKG